MRSMPYKQGWVPNSMRFDFHEAGRTQHDAAVMLRKYSPHQWPGEGKWLYWVTPMSTWAPMPEAVHTLEQAKAWTVAALRGI